MHLIYSVYAGSLEQAFACEGPLFFHNYLVINRTIVHYNLL